MATLDVVNQSGEKVGQIELADAVFATPVREQLLWEAVVGQLATRRAGSACTKRRGEVQGSTRKIYRQKGTGRGRHGSIRAGIFVGGGKAHGPKPRSYDQHVPKKVKRGALRCALSLRVKEQRLLVLEDLNIPEIKTKNMLAMLDKLGVKKGLIIDDSSNLTLIKSVRNLAHAKYLAPEGLNVYDILRFDTLVVTAPVAKKIEERLLP
jgi:large subunit ribosomal protein L4